MPLFTPGTNAALPAHSKDLCVCLTIMHQPQTQGAGSGHLTSTARLHAVAADPKPGFFSIKVMTKKITQVFFVFSCKIPRFIFPTFLYSRDGWKLMSAESPQLSPAAGTWTWPAQWQTPGTRPVPGTVLCWSAGSRFQGSFAPLLLCYLLTQCSGVPARVCSPRAPH